TASINGLTYLYQFVLADSPSYLGWWPNLYARGKFERNFQNPFSGEDAKQFNDAAEKFEAGESAEAAKLFDELAAKYPAVSPLSVRAAEAHARAGQIEEAMKSLVMAIRGGWFSSTYLRDSEDLAEIVSQPGVSEVLDRLNDAPATLQGPIGFGGERGWTGNGFPVRADQGGVPYMMSCVLGVKHPRGSTVEQIVKYLTVAAGADRTFPKGKFGFAKTTDVRSTTRMPGVPAALGRLLSNRQVPEIFKSALPTDKEDYIGLLLGTATMNLRDRPFRIVPGAIAESLTSTGAAFATGAQTKCTELLHAGAALTSGAVAEPFSLQFKFPLPAIHAYYSEGVSAIEAMYLTVSSPYQLLIVGDPVCQPFASPPDEKVDISMERGEMAVVTILRTPNGALADPKSAARVEIFAQGRFAKSTAPSETIRLRLPATASGIFDLRVGLVAPGPLESRISHSFQLDLNGPLEAPKVTPVPRADKKLTVKVSSPGATSIQLKHFDEVIDTVNSDSGEITFDRKSLGDGPLRVKAFAIHGNQKLESRNLVVGNESKED
ncbi:MAG: hypothetical protein AAF989_16215, partial [Planctomycetota bacterium]